MKKLANPNFIYILVFIVPFLVYSLGWSTIYPELSAELFGFYLLTFVIALFGGVLVDMLPGFTYKPIPEYRYNLPVMLALFFLFALDCLYMGYIPLFTFAAGEARYGGSINFGIPTLHVIFVTFNLFFSIYLFHQYLSNRKWTLLLLYISSFIPFIFLIQRSNIMYIIIGSSFLFFISQKSISIKKIILLAAFGLGAIYLFGYLGNIRSANGDATYIPRSSGATESFLNSSIPKEFYWGYLYIGSPVANLQNNINIEQNVYPDYEGFVVFEMTPDFASKQLAKLFALNRREFHQINSFLNVGTIYARPFSFLSWTGMFLIFVYLMTLMNAYYLVMRKSYLYGATGVSLMFTIIAIATFENTIWFSAYSFPLFFPFIFSLARGARIKTRNQAIENQPSLYGARVQQP